MTEYDDGTIATRLDDLTELHQHPDGWIKIRQRNLHEETDTIALAPETLHKLLRMTPIVANLKRDVAMYKELDDRHHRMLLNDIEIIKSYQRDCKTLLDAARAVLELPPHAVAGSQALADLGRVVGAMNESADEPTAPD